jgi:quercetin dioxygenase-like cupin family protein
MSASGTHNPPEFKHAEDMEWEMGRFGNVTKFLFHPRPERPTEPNAGFLKYAPGASFPLHRHDFAQIWYIIDGEFTHRCGSRQAVYARRCRGIADLAT